MSENAKPAAGVQSFLDCSTGHLMLRDSWILKRWAKIERGLHPGMAPYRTIGHSYGWFVHVHQDDDRVDYENLARAAGMSGAFFALQEYARSNGCWWINFDGDADTLDGFDVFDWERAEHLIRTNEQRPAREVEHA